MISIGWPIDLVGRVAEQLLAAGFQLVTIPSSVNPKIPSPEPSTIADSRRPAASAIFRSVMSIEEPITATRSPSTSEHRRVGDEHRHLRAIAPGHLVVARPRLAAQHRSRIISRRRSGASSRTMSSADWRPTASAADQP